MGGAKAWLGGLAMVGIGACGDEGNLPIGATCDVPEECEGGLCVDSVCIDPVGCGEAIASGQTGPLVDACLAGLSTIVVTPATVSANPGETVQFKAEGVFREAGGTTAAPTEDSALTATLDVTRLASWAGAEGVTFSSETPGLAEISANAFGSLTIEAILRTGEIIDGEAANYLRSTATLELGGEGEPR